MLIEKNARTDQTFDSTIMTPVSHCIINGSVMMTPFALSEPTNKIARFQQFVP